MTSNLQELRWTLRPGLRAGFKALASGKGKGRLGSSAGAYLGACLLARMVPGACLVCCHHLATAGSRQLHAISHLLGALAHKDNRMILDDVLVSTIRASDSSVLAGDSFVAGKTSCAGQSISHPHLFFA